MPDEPQGVPVLVGIVIDGGQAGSGCHIDAGGGRQVPLDGGKCPVGHLYLTTAEQGAWNVVLQRSDGPLFGGSACWATPYLTEYAWDHGDYVTIVRGYGQNRQGLRLPKGPGFASAVRPSPAFSASVYHDMYACLNEAGQIVYLSIPPTN